ncbi:MAG: hypothetical protein AAB619_01090 [Patescibacteria group bacterium]
MAPAQRTVSGGAGSGSAGHIWPFIGQTALGHHLLTSLENGQLASVLLFVGPRAVGKATAAKWLSRYDLCRGSGIRPCDRCSACRQTAGQVHPDQRLIDPLPGVGISIEEIRQAVSAYTVVQWNDGTRWLIIIEAERMTEAAANTMLKFLEELPPRLRVILTSAEPDRLLPTLRSRATTYRWHTVTSTDLRQAEIGQSGSLTDRVARAAGRPGWYVQLAEDPEALLQDRQAMAQTLTALAAGAVRQVAGQSSAPRLTVADQLAREELVIRELLLTAVGSLNRLLWPSAHDSMQEYVATLSPRRLLSFANRFLDRHEYSPNVQPRLLYEDLHLV